MREREIDRQTDRERERERERGGGGVEGWGAGLVFYAPRLSTQEKNQGGEGDGNF